MIFTKIANIYFFKCIHYIWNVRHISLQFTSERLYPPCVFFFFSYRVWGLGAFLRWWPPSACYVGGSFNLFMATTGGVWIIPSFRIWDYVLHVEHVSCVITNCGQHQWVIPSPLSIALEALLEENTTRKLLSLTLDLYSKILLFRVACLIIFSIAIFSPYFHLIGLLLQSVAVFQSRELVKYLE